MKNKNLLKLGVGFSMALSLVACSQSKTESVPEEKVVLPTGASVNLSEDSPTGYVATFRLEKTDNIQSAKLTGPFQYVDPEMDLHDPENAFGPNDYKAGMYATNCAPGPFSWGYTVDMPLNEEGTMFEVEIPITSGSFAYSYIITNADGEEETIADPASPSPAALSTKSNFQTGDITHSIVYGRYDEKKQAGSPNLDFVLDNINIGTTTYVEYKGNLADDQDMGIYVPNDYDAKREEPYKVVYMSHGGGGNETDWFAMGNAANIAANLGVDYILVTMDNSSYNWDFDQIEDNVMNYIIPYMEENYNVSKESKDRAFCGLSMGSMTTFHMFYDHAADFGYFGAFSGTDMNAIHENPDLDKAVFFFDVGTCDIASAEIMPNDDDAQKKKYEDYVEYLKEHPMDNVIDGGYVEGAHDWFVWSQSLHTFLKDIAFK